MKYQQNPTRHPSRLVRALMMAVIAVIGAALTPKALATANYVYHERTGNDPGCGGQYVTTLTPNSAQAHPLRWKIEYQFYTDTTRVYYTTDGSTPSGAFGTPSGTTLVLNGSYTCTFGSPLVDVASATIPAQPPGTVVKYIISAWHSAGGSEIFANSGEFSSPFTTSSAATVFTYTVSTTPESTVLVESRASGGALTGNPPYLETGTWTDSSSKSTASGLAGTGSRFATNGTPSFKVTPTLTVGVTYTVQSTLTATTASSDLVASIATTGTSASTLPATTTAFQSGKGNVWTTLGTITPSSTTPSITFTYASGTLNSSAARFYADGIRFIPVTASGTKIWNGGGGNNFWTTGLNWGGTSPNLAGGDALVFGGGTRTNPVMDSPFSITSLTFNSGASNFFITSGGGSLVIGSGGITNNSAGDQTVAVPIAQGATALNVATGTKTTTVNGLLTGSGGYTATGTGTLYVSNSANTITGPVSVSGGATLRLPASSSIGGTGAGSGNVTLNGGTFRNDDLTVAGTLLTQNRTILIGSGGGTINVPSSSGLLLSSNIITGAGNILTLNGAGEVRFMTNGVNATGGHFTFAKLVVDGAMWTIGQGSIGGAEDSLGAVPALTTDDAITLQNGGRLRGNVAPITLDSKRGITLGTGGGTLRAVNSSTTLSIPSAIKGANQLTIGGGTDTGIVNISNPNNSFGNVTIAGASGTRLQLGASGVVPDTSSINLSASGVVFDLNGNSETVRTVTGTAGTIALGAGGVLTINNTSPDNDTFTSSITGTGGLIVKKGTGTWNVTGTTGWGSLRVENGTYGVGGANGLGNGTLTVQGGKIASTSGTTRSVVTTAVNLNGDAVFGDSVNTGGLTFGLSCPWTIQNASRVLNVDTVTLTITGPISDDGTPRGFTKAGSGTLRLTGTNTFGGDLTNSAGTISINDTLSPFGNGAGTIVLAGGNISLSVDRGVTANNIVNPLVLTANSELQAPTTTGTRNLVFGGPLSGTAGALTIHNTSATAGPATFSVRLTNTFTFNQPIASVIDTVGNTNQLEIWNRSDLGPQTYNGVISGPLYLRRSATTANTGGKVTFNATNTYSIGTALNEGEIALGSDSFGPAGAPTGGPLGTGPVNIGNDGGKLSASGGARNLKNNFLFSNAGRTLTFVGANDLELSGNIDLAAFTNITFVSSNSGNSVLSGNISNGGLVKSGPGQLTVAGSANTYAGQTLVNNGLLRVDGALPAASVVTVAGGTLGGSGTVNGAVNVLSGGNLAPGASIGTLTINNTLALGGTATIEVDKGAGQTSDKVLGVTTLTEGGILQVANLGTALAAGDSFPVFSAATYTGSFASVTPAPGAALAWDTEKLRTNGVLLVHNVPVAGDDVASVQHGQTTTIPVFKLLANDSGEVGETLAITAVSSNASLGGGLVTYTAPLSGSSDVINYTLSDGRGGTSTGTIFVTLTSSGGSYNQLSAVALGGGDVQLKYLGIPGTNYALDRTFNLTPPVTWVPQFTNAAAENGYLIFTNTPDPSTNNFWRTRYVP